MPSEELGRVTVNADRQGIAGLEEAALVTRATAADPSAYEELVRRYRADAVRLATRITGCRTEAEEVAQEAFLKALRALPSFRDGSPFRPWLLRIVANQARDHLRARARRERILESLQSLPDLGLVAQAPELQALANVENRRLLDALHGLAEADQLVIACRYLLELSERETAAALDVPPGTVKSRLFRAITRLRTRLEAGERGPHHARERALANAHAVSHLHMLR